MTDKEAKKELMRRAATVDATVRVGKDGLSDTLMEEIRQQVKRRRLIKVKILSNSDTEITEAAEKIAAAAESVVVDIRGGVIVLTDRRTWDSLCQKKF